MNRELSSRSAAHVPMKSALVLRTWLAAAVLLLCPAVLVGQTGRVTGRVLAEGGQPLSAVEIRLVEADVGTHSNPAGAFELTAPAGTYTLRASVIGRSTVEQSVQVVAGETVRVELVLVQRAIELDEILVSLSAVAARRVQIGTDIERLSVAQDLERSAVTSLSDVLNSRAPGVSIALGTGEVGAASKIRVRGATSLTQGNNPVIFIDGVRVSNNTAAGPRAIDFGDGPTISRLDDLNPQDIEDIQVLKGPTAAAAYGSEAAAGVLLITTKRGLSAAPRFEFMSEVGVNRNVSTFEDNYFNLTTLGGFTDVDHPVIQQFRPERNPVTGHIFGRHNPLQIYDPFRTGVNRRTSLSVSGGLENVQYFASARWDAEEGVLPNNDSERLAARMNFVAHLTDAIDVALNSSYMSAEVRTGGSGRSPTSLITQAQLGLPEFGYGVREDGSRGDCAATILYGAPESVCARQHGHFSAPPWKTEQVLNNHDADRFITGLTLNVRPWSWLSNRLVLGIDHLSAQDLNIMPLDPDRPFGDQSRGEVADTRRTERHITFDFASTVNANVASNLQTTTTVGAQYFNRRSDALGCRGIEGFAGPTATACNASAQFTLSTSAQEVAEAGAYIQETLGWNDYLFVTGALRVDDHSGVGANQGAITLPSANVSLVVSRMPFWRYDWVDILRLRAAWGRAAQAPGPFDATTTFVPVRLDQNGVQVTGISPQNPGNPDLKHEENEEFEVGFDLAFLNERVSLKLTYFNQQVTDAILSRRVSPGTGFPGSQFVNIGRVENQGLEGMIDVRLLDRRMLSGNASLHFSTEDPKITDMGGIEPITGFFGMAGMMHEGYAPGAYYGPIYTDAQRAPNGSIVPGSARWLEGNLDFGQAQGFRYLGRPNPTNEQTLNTSWTFQNRLTLSALFNRRAGHMRMNTLDGRRNCFIMNRSGGRMCAFRQAELTPAEQAALEGRVADAPMLFLHDASFIKLREVTLRYALPQALIARIPAASAGNLTLGGRNLVTWTKFPGVDPEVDISSGVDGFGNTGNYGELDPARMFFARFSFTF